MRKTIIICLLFTFLSSCNSKQKETYKNYTESDRQKDSLINESSNGCDGLLYLTRGEVSQIKILDLRYERLIDIFGSSQDTMVKKFFDSHIKGWGSENPISDKVASILSKDYEPTSILKDVVETEGDNGCADVKKRLFELTIRKDILNKRDNELVAGVITFEGLLRLDPTKDFAVIEYIKRYKEFYKEEEWEDIK